MNPYPGTEQNDDRSWMIFLAPLFILLWVVVLSFFARRLRYYWKLYTTKIEYAPGPLLLTLYYASLTMQPMTQGAFKDGTKYSLIMSGMPKTEDQVGSMSHQDADYSVKQYQYGDIAEGFALATGQATPFESMEQGLANLNNSPRLMIVATLSAHSPVHIVSISKTDDGEVDPRLLKANNLASARLEGNFPDFFRLYCEADRQREVREVLDPATMAMLIDYCQEYDWEIADTSFYAVVRDDVRMNGDPGTTLMVQDAELFLGRIKSKLDLLVH